MASIHEMASKINWYKIHYPSECFEANPGRKPALNVAKTSLTFDELRETVAHGIKHKNIDCMAAAAYLYALMENNPERLDDAWISFGREIGAAGSTITIANLVNVIETVETVSYESMLGVSAKDDQWIVVYLCAMYRIADKIDNGSRAKIVESVKRELKEKHAPDYAIVNQFGHHPFNRQLMAAMDMFFVRFPNNNFAHARIGTMTSRFHHCAALNDLLYLKEVSGLDFSEIRQWIWLETLESNLEVLLHPDNEIDDKHSYMPYLWDLNLSTRSPYSSAICPNLHRWIHVVGCCLGSARSVCSRMLNGDSEIIPKHAIVFGFALKIMKESSTTKTETPKNLCGKEWFIWYINQNRQLNDDVIKTIRPVFKTFNRARDNTIGKFLYTFEF